jgi:hypothetical protein
MFCGIVGDLRDLGWTQVESLAMRKRYPERSRRLVSYLFHLGILESARFG